MERMQPFFRLNKKKMVLEVQEGKFKWWTYSLKEEELSIVEKLMQRDFKTAILNRHHDNEGIETLANDILTQKG